MSEQEHTFQLSPKSKTRYDAGPCGELRGRSESAD